MTGYTYKTKSYFAFTFIVTFALWLAGAYVSHRDSLKDLYMLFMLPGLLTPFLASLGFIFLSGNGNMKKDFLGRLVNVRLIDPKTLPVLLLLMPATIIVSALISIAFGGSASQLQPAEGFSFSSGFVPVLLLLFLAASFEELGWRGYAFDSLRNRYSFFKASLVFSILWSLWHAPLLLVKDSYQYEILHQNPWYALNFFASIIPMGIIISWICVKNRKSVPAAILFHFVINLSQEVLNISQATKCIETGVLALVVAVIVMMDKEFFFKKDTMGHAA